ncbi:cytochrome P450 9e2-like [Homarus americanus]|uniref:cytochrome P450 9e2-like n=1 Tax=Homarus americanus TaxID=6706 RepID=UPI001C4721A0|nr:cytochrome P450 9e2-like [Homarus americanus]XP_042203444.1 cytochrome P450 9e2-like [Homarus americanus]
MGVEVWLLLVVGVLMALAYSRWRHSYWSSRGVPTPPIIPFLGHIHALFLKGLKPLLYENEVYSKYGGSTFCGKYEMFRPILVVGDLELMKHITVKDFDYFTDRRNFTLTNEGDDVMNDMITNKTGNEWKTLRSIMTPTFTSGKMRGMYPLVCDKADDLVSFSLKEAANNPHIDMKHNFGRFTMDTIASCAFGIECNSFENENSEFPKAAASFFQLTWKRKLSIIFLITLPKVFKFFKLRFNPPSLDFFAEVVKETIAAREKGAKRGDFLDLLMEAGKDNPEKKQVLNYKSILAQSILFLIAGYDTTASTLAFASFFLAKNSTHQQHLRKELQGIVKEHGDLTYQGIMEAKFLDACLLETLRLYPPAPMLERQCTKDYQLPGTELKLHKGDIVQFPVWSIHHDPKYWPEPNEFRPHRFMPENRDNITTFTHMPFGLGPRNCIAMRFALMEAKVALGKMILAADLQLAPGYEEMEVEFGVGILRPKNGVNLILKPLSEE